MSNLVDDLGNAVVACLQANAAAFTGALGKTGATLHAEYGQQARQWPKGAGGRCQVAFDSLQTPREDALAGSAASTYRFSLRFELRDPRGTRSAVAVVTQGLQSAFADAGAAIFDTHFVDSGANRLGKGGEGTWELDVDRNAELDPDSPVVFVALELTLTHKLPLI